MAEGRVHRFRSIKYYKMYHGTSIMIIIFSPLVLIGF